VVGDDKLLLFQASPYSGGAELRMFQLEIRWHAPTTNSSVCSSTVTEDICETCQRGFNTPSLTVEPAHICAARPSLWRGTERGTALSRLEAAVKEVGLSHMVEVKRAGLEVRETRRHAVIGERLSYC